MDRHVDDAMPQRLIMGERFAELDADLRVAHGRRDHRLHQPDAFGAPGRKGLIACAIERLERVLIRAEKRLRGQIDVPQRDPRGLSAVDGRMRLDAQTVRTGGNEVEADSVAVAGRP